MKFIKKNLFSIVLTFFIVFIPLVSFAQTTTSGTTTGGTTTSGTTTSDPNAGKIVNPLGTTKTLPDLIKAVLTDAIKIGIPIVSLAIIYCGFLFVFARGNSEKITKAKEALLWTLIGAAILLGALTIANIIASTVTAL
jgi:hypothetical protein